MFELPFFSHPPPPPPPPPPPTTNPLSTMFATSTLGLAVLFILRSRKQRAEITHLTKDLNRLFVDKEKAEMALMQTELNLQKTFVEKERELAAVYKDSVKPATLHNLLLSGTKAVCIGKNYREHITELAQLGPEWKLEEEPEPVLFLKPTSSYAWPGQPLVIPRRRPAVLGGGITTNHGVHHEVELGVIIGSTAKDITDDASAMECVAGYVLGLDMTERDEQTTAKNKGMPWAASKGYDSFLPLSHPFSLAPGEDWRTLKLWLDVNGTRRQACEAGTMIHSVPKLIQFISSIMTLQPGDLILTGTPKGVGQVVPGDTITAGIIGKAEMSVQAVSPPPKALKDPFILKCDITGSWTTGALSGLTFAAKDNLDVEGLPTGNGNPCWAKTIGVQPAKSNPSVAAMLSAGAKLVGKTHMDELAFSVAGENAHYGTLDNPIASGRTVGGSSSGSAVSVASGLVDVALGSDTTGSVRVPSAHCGLYGMRPSHGSLSGDGVATLAKSYDTVGWFTRTKEHLVKVGKVLLPPDSYDNPTNTTTKPTILIADDALQRYKGEDNIMTKSAHQAVEKVASSIGGEVRHFDLGVELLKHCPSLHDLKAADGLEALCTLQREEQAGEFWEALGPWAESIDDKIGRKPLLSWDVTPRMMWAKATSTAPIYAKGESWRVRARKEVKAALESLLSDGTLICFIPVAGPPPLPGGAADLEYRKRTFELQAPAGLAGLPQVVLPAGTTSGGLPLAVTFVGAKGSDRRVLELL